MQVATFAILLVALVAIGVRIARAVRAADRAKSRSAAPDATNDR